MPSTSPPHTRIGCGYLLVTIGITCLMLTINGMIVTNGYYTATVTMPPGSIPPRLGQAIVFLGPVLLLFLEWWVFDVTVDWLRPQQRAPKG